MLFEGDCERDHRTRTGRNTRTLLTKENNTPIVQGKHTARVRRPDADIAVLVNRNLILIVG